MKFLLFAGILSAVLCVEYAVTKAETDYLKEHVDWEVMDYDDNVFRGWTLEEFEAILDKDIDPIDHSFPAVEIGVVPSAINWRGSSCDHTPRNQGSCEASWAFAPTAVLSDKCCILGKHEGWLAPQEVISCDKESKGCKGGLLRNAFHYFEKYGLLDEADFPYEAKTTRCPSYPPPGIHHCYCKTIFCEGTVGMQNCLKTGPVTFSFYVCSSFISYKNGIYHCDCTKYLGGHRAEAIGYSNDPECYFLAKNSWGTSWGDRGYFSIGCTTCGFQPGWSCDSFA